MSEITTTITMGTGNWQVVRDRPTDDRTISLSANKRMSALPEYSHQTSENLQSHILADFGGIVDISTQKNTFQLSHNV